MKNTCTTILMIFIGFCLKAGVVNSVIIAGNNSTYNDYYELVPIKDEYKEGYFSKDGKPKNIVVDEYAETAEEIKYRKMMEYRELHRNNRNIASISRGIKKEIEEMNALKSAHANNIDNSRNLISEYKKAYFLAKKEERKEDRVRLLFLIKKERSKIKKLRLVRKSLSSKIREHKDSLKQDS